MIRSVLVPLDGSPFGEHALPLAVSVARRAGATLRLLHVQSLLDSYFSDAPLLDETLEASLKERQRLADLAYLHAVGKRLSALAPVSVTPLVAEGEVAATITAQAIKTAADLVVMTTHGRGPLGRFWMGSVADELVRTLPIPLLLVRPREAAPDFRKELVLKRLLVPLDGSDLAEQVLEPALALGQLMDAEYTLVRVIRPILPLGVLPEAGTFGEQTREMIDKVEAEQRRQRAEAEKYLEQVATRLREQSLQVQTRVLVEDRPVAGILDEAQAAGADLIALGTHGRRGLARLLVGSVADKVVRGSPLPVLLHRPRQA